jgi:uncharacterized protein
VKSILVLWLALLLCPMRAASQAPVVSCPPQLQPPTAEQMQAAARNASDHGLLWRLTRDGNTSYLFGTIHVGKLDWIMPGPKIRAALMAVDTIALEIDPLDPDMAARMASASGNIAPRLKLAAPLAERLARRLDAACLPAPARPGIDAMHPLMQAVTLSILEARWEGLDAGYALEFALAGFGRAVQRRMVSLETPESQFAALMPTDADEMIKAIGDTLDQLDKGDTRRAIARLAQAWARGDLAELEQYERWCECVQDEADRKQLARMIDERNPLLAERIEALHRGGRKVFAGVGALHMVGTQALPTLLRARGFTVERVAFQ